MLPPPESEPSCGSAVVVVRVLEVMVVLEPSELVRVTVSMAVLTTALRVVEDFSSSLLSAEVEDGSSSRDEVEDGVSLSWEVVVGVSFPASEVVGS